MSRIDKSIETESGLERGVNRTSGFRVSFWSDENALKLARGPTLWVY